MKYRPRWALLGIGLVVIALIYSFPLWDRLISNKAAGQQAAFALASDAQMEAFAKMPKDKREIAYYAMLTAVPAPTEEQPTPVMADASAILSGDFTTLDAVRTGNGKATIYRAPDDTTLLRFEDFSVTNAPRLTVYLCDVASPQDMKKECNDRVLFAVGQLKGSVGNQQYKLPPELDLKIYKSVIIYSEDLGVIYTSAPLS